MTNMAINDLIKAGRKQLAMTEQRFADSVGVSRGAVQQWESGATAPARKHQEAVARLIGISVGELMSGVSTKYPSNQESQHKTGEEVRQYNPDGTTEIQDLWSQMNTTGRLEALDYLRYLAKRHPADFSKRAADGSGDTLSRHPKAA